MDSLTAVLMQFDPTQRELIEHTLHFLSTNQLSPEDIARLNQMFISSPMNNNTHRSRTQSASCTGRKKKSHILPGQRTLDEYWNS
jgi:hypothetical protein